MSSNFVRRGLLATAALVTIALIVVATAHLPLVRARVLPWAPAPPRLGTTDLRQISIEVEDDPAGRHVAVGPIDLTLASPPAHPSPGAFGPGAFTVRLPAPHPQPPTKTLS